MSNSLRKNPKWMRLCIGSVIALGGMTDLVAAARDDQSFSFKKYKQQDNETAKKLAEDELNNSFKTGSSLRNAIDALNAAGAKCSILKKHPDFVYCTYEHADAGVRGLFITVEWKVLVYFDQQTGTTTHIEVNRGLTGL